MFPTTNWTAIEHASTSTAARRRTLHEIANAYREPLVRIAKRRGLGHDDAEEVVQDVFARFVEHDVVRRLDRARGRLRSLLCTALGNAIAHRIERERARKRGGGAVMLPFDDNVIPASDDAFAHAFDQAWRAAVLDRAFRRLAAEHRAGPFDVVLAYFRGDDPPSLAELAVQHATTVPALKSLLHRARARFRAIVRDEVAATLGSLSDLDDELRALLL